MFASREFSAREGLDDSRRNDFVKPRALDSSIFGLRIKTPCSYNFRLATNRDARTTGDSDALNDFKELLSPIFVKGVRWGAASLVAWQ